MGITEKVAYLKGLADGLGLDKDTKEGKLFAAIIDILDDMALEMRDIEDEQCEIEEGLDAVSDDLNDVEEFLYEAFDDEDEDDEDEDDDDEDDPAYGTTCPNCEEDIFFDEDVLEEGYVICPNCGEKLDFDLDSLEDECDCGSDCCGCGEDE